MGLRHTRICTLLSNASSEKTTLGWPIANLDDVGASGVSQLRLNEVKISQANNLNAAGSCLKHM